MGQDQAHPVRFSNGLSQDPAQRMGAIAVARVAHRIGHAQPDARLRLYASGVAQQHGNHRRGRHQGAGLDPQPRTFRSLRPADRFPAKVSRQASGRPHALCGWRGQFLCTESRKRSSWTIRRIGRARSPRTGGAESEGGFMRAAHYHPGARLYHRCHRPAQFRKSAPDRSSRVRSQERRRVQHADC